MDKQTLIDATGISNFNADLFYDPILNALAWGGIDKPPHIAAFLAQFSHETQSFSVLVENLNYSAQGLVATWPTRFSDVGEPNKFYAEKYARHPDMIANLVYANRMGNGPEQSGDGYKYRGRGLPMVTGKDYYSACGDGIKADLINNPQLLEQPICASLAGAWVWKDKSCGNYIDKNDFTGLTRAINGGTIGLEDRLVRWSKAKKALGVL